MEILHPRRILILSHPSTPPDLVLKALTTPTPVLSNKAQIPSSTSPPDQTSESVHRIETPYYSATVPIWQDTFPSSGLEDWAQEWTSMPGASDVVEEIGAWVVCFERPRSQGELESIKAMLKTVAGVVSHHHDSGDPYSGSGSGSCYSEALMQAVCLPQTRLPALELSIAEWDDLCLENGGWEFIDSQAEGKNEFGELLGLPRLKEALQSADWEIDQGDEVEDGLLNELEELNEDGGILFDGIEGDIKLETDQEKSGMAEPMLGHGDSMAAEDGEDEVDELQRMLVKLQAARDMGADLPQSERRKHAARAVREIMKT